MAKSVNLDEVKKHHKAGSMFILAILQNAMTHDVRDVGKNMPIFFTINPRNYTGKKLYKMTRGHYMVVTNACPILGYGPKSKGETDLDHIKKGIYYKFPNIEKKFDMLLVCGKQAQEAVYQIEEEIDVPIIFMPHPASRTLTNLLTDRVEEYINCIHGEINDYHRIQLIQQKGRVDLNIKMKHQEKKFILQ